VGILSWQVSTLADFLGKSELVSVYSGSHQNLKGLLKLKKAVNEQSAGQQLVQHWFITEYIALYTYIGRVLTVLYRQQGVHHVVQHTTPLEPVGSRGVARISTEPLKMLKVQRLLFPPGLFDHNFFRQIYSVETVPLSPSL
jgi:hypothetical protein